MERVRKRIISASRRTDLVAYFPDWLSDVLRKETALVKGPRGRPYTVRLSPEEVHTIVLWSKNFSNLIRDHARLRKHLSKYDQIYLHFTISGLGGTNIEPGAPSADQAFSQLGELVSLVKNPRRISVRFDPVVFWEEKGKRCSNIAFFKTLAPIISRTGIRDVRFSFAQWYGKAARRARQRGFPFVDPPDDIKREEAAALAETAAANDLSLYSCCQPLLESLEGIQPSSCIEGSKLQALHPGREPALKGKDPGQRRDCRCTISTDIGSYTQVCSHSCVYCYANPGSV